MKRLFFITMAALALLPVGAAAQNFSGGIETSKVTITHEGEYVILEMVIDIQKDAVTKCQSVAIAPALSNGGNHLVFRHVLVNGKNRSRMFERKEKFRNMELEKDPPLEVVNIDKNSRGKKINYAAAAPYEPWMDNAAISLQLVLTSCSGETQLYSTELSAASITVAPQEPAAAPVVVADTPKTPAADTGAAKQCSGTAYLDFEPESSVIIPYYKRNSQELNKVDEELGKIKSNPDAEIIKLTIIGYASPEGRYSGNATLAYRRAQAFAGYIQNKYGIPVQYSNVSVVAEDWDTLRKMVVNSDIPNLDKVLSIMDSGIAADAKESKLRRLDNGVEWNIMLHEMFPKLRRVEYKVDYKIK